ncbi:uncharacterized protein [Littorina saxatilis]|uniref:uncharacterized protein isoform X3 n=1 Tax=Littorina saxatilis TaxID=31220 RepID=UPI0038B5DD62
MGSPRYFPERDLMWIPYRLRLEDWDKDDWPDPETSPYKLDLERSQIFRINGYNPLMEKPGSTTAQRHNHDGPAWGEKGGEGGGPGGGVQHTQYIRRLADLRDELINQEETALARALDRLRLHSINNRDAARYRLKIKAPATAAEGMPSVNGNSPFPRPMVTTVEKFRQMRPQRRPPVIFPLQGKQLIESSLTGNGSATRSSTEEGPRVEDTVKANLSRLIQPTSSIPNIGRKALRQESLELKTQSLQNMRNRVFKGNRPHMASPFMLGAHGDEGGLDSRGDSDGELNLSPHAYKLGPMTDGDRINMDKLNQYYYICCLPDTPSSREGEGQGRSMALSTPRHGQPRKGLSRLGGGPNKNRRTSSERSHPSRPFSDRSSVGGMVVSSDTEVEAPLSSRHKNSVDTLTGSERVTFLPVIHADGESPTHPRPPQESFLTQRDRRSPSTPDTLLSTERRRRHIVVDMPHIIFNAATPDMSKEPPVPESLPLTDRPGALSKTLKQNEIRHRELQNLIEDVKELNKRTETLNTHVQNTERDAQPGVC